jgi:dolichol-phosphate mannosyltransferase
MNSAPGLRIVPSTRDVAADRERVAVVIPCYRVRATILDVLGRIGAECHAIYVVDDACPDGTGERVESECHDARVRVLRHERNQGVGGAVITGYARALEDGATVLVKLDGDGQMDPADLPRLLAPILACEADYVKGNRFHDLTHIRRMPWVRLIGNAGLSFLTKLSSGYWDVFDPTNGYTAIHGEVLRLLPLDRIAKRWFFESDLLYHLGLCRAVVKDVAMDARYDGQRSNLNVLASMPSFAVRHLFNLCRRIFYNYFLRDFSAASVELALGLPLLLFGVVFGAVQWIHATRSGVGAYGGTVMLAALPVIVGVQMLLAFLSFDVGRVPREPLHEKSTS